MPIDCLQSKKPTASWSWTRGRLSKRGPTRNSWNWEACMRACTRFSFLGRHHCQVPFQPSRQTSVLALGKRIPLVPQQLQAIPRLSRVLGPERQACHAWEASSKKTDRSISDPSLRFGIEKMQAAQGPTLDLVALQRIPPAKVRTQGITLLHVRFLPFWRPVN